jgi:redox-sensitive bicupin YhaK (pirin superfamily)
MITLRRAGERGHARHGWLESYHTFSFADYRDPRHMGFRDLRVINEDRVQPGRGFGTHSHRDMEIVSYVIDGALEHRDSLGTGSVIRPGDVQRMSAGTGVTHSEYNASPSELVHFLQIWILPERQGIAPSYEQRHFPPEEREGVLRLVASRDGRDGSVRLHQDVDLYAALLRPGKAVELALRPGRHAWVQLVRGPCELGSVRLEAGDGAALSGEPALSLRAAEPSELLVFDLP